jgi:hypothetical protein
MLVKEFYVRHELARIAREMDFTSIENFYQNNLAITDAKLIQSLLHKKVIKKIDCVSNFMKCSKVN